MRYGTCPPYRTTQSLFELRAIGPRKTRMHRNTWRTQGSRKERIDTKAEESLSCFLPDADNQFFVLSALGKEGMS